jgi:hypothetical protein
VAAGREEVQFIPQDLKIASRAAPEFEGKGRHALRKIQVKCGNCISRAFSSSTPNITKIK